MKSTKMKIIGITGPIGSGKSYIANLFEQKGFAHLDTDEIYHELVSSETECTRQIKEYFGDSVIAPDGSVDRKILGGIVFNDKAKLEALNKITHAHVETRTKALIAELKKNGERAVIIEVPLMFESGFDKLCDAVICVISDTEARIQRVMQRNLLTREQAELRMKNQKSTEYYRSNSDYTVVNNGDEDINEQIRRILEKMGL